MIRLHFTMDSKRRGEQTLVRDLRQARKEIRCPRPVFTSTKFYGYPKSWEVTCGDTVVADAHKLPKGKGEDYYPKYPMGRPKKRSCKHGRTSSGSCLKRSR
jgi:hypothetical protein